MADGSMAGRSPADRRRPLISGNWKMHHTHLDAIQVIQKLAFRLDPDTYSGLDVSVHPAFTALRSVQTVLEADRIPIALGAQNCHWEDKGAFTGEVSPTMLAKLNVRYVIVGHSERRELFGETDESANRKVRAVLAAGMTPILCVGETLEEREADGTEDKVRHQVTAGLDGVAAAAVAGLVVAYEPIWAIGTGRNATPEDAQATIAAIRAAVGGQAGSDAAAAVRIQYGGSVKPDNAGELMAQPDIDGALVGGASLDPDVFAAVVRGAVTGA
jgi:triosephosphate isomerase